MAIIGGKAYPPVETPEAYLRRVVVKFQPDVNVPYTLTASDSLLEKAGHSWKELTDTFPGVVLTPYFSASEESMLLGFAKAGLQAATLPQQFTSYFEVICQKGVDPNDVAKVIAGWSSVETAYVEDGPAPPPVSPVNDPLNTKQGYLDAAPIGIDARWAWMESDGSGVGFVDVEQGWTLNHEDLFDANIALISGLNLYYHGHGTAVLGEVVGVDNRYGGIGIASRASARVISQWRNSGDYKTAHAIICAAYKMKRGDVMLLEAQTNSPKLPVEVDDVVFNAIKTATSQGIVIVEAGANGGVDLNAYRDLKGKCIFNRESSDFRDSGAIVVGAASSTLPHRRLSFSNFGNRIDCYAWGENIATCGDGWQGTNRLKYTWTFGGTSGSSPIVAGAALLLQSWRVRHELQPYSPDTIRTLLSNPTLNTRSGRPEDDRIGVMPNLKAIIERELLAGIVRGKPIAGNREDTM